MGNWLSEHFGDHEDEPQKESDDVQKVIDTHTGDGPGDEDPGEGDFIGYEDPDIMEEGLK